MTEPGGIHQRIPRRGTASAPPPPVLPVRHAARSTNRQLPHRPGGPGGKRGNGRIIIPVTVLLILGCWATVLLRASLASVRDAAAHDRNEAGRHLRVPLGGLPVKPAAGRGGDGHDASMVDDDDSGDEVENRKKRDDDDKYRNPEDPELEEERAEREWRRDHPGKEDDFEKALRDSIEKNDDDTVGAGDDRENDDVDGKKNGDSEKDDDTDRKVDDDAEPDIKKDDDGVVGEGDGGDQNNGGGDDGDGKKDGDSEKYDDMVKAIDDDAEPENKKDDDDAVGEGDGGDQNNGDDADADGKKDGDSEKDGDVDRKVDGKVDGDAEPDTKKDDDDAVGAGDGADQDNGDGDDEADADGKKDGDSEKDDDADKKIDDDAEPDTKKDDDVSKAGKKEGDTEPDAKNTTDGAVVGDGVAVGGDEPNAPVPVDFVPIHDPQLAKVSAGKINPVEDPDLMIDMRDLAQTLPFENKDGGVWKQGWDVPPMEGDLTVFVLPHSHNDPGWIKTFDAYFQTQTKHILTTVFNALMKDERRKFIWAEISYFEWWWKEQTLSVQEQMKTLVSERRFEFVTGGWVMPDEANSDIYALEVQLDEGRAWIEEHFGLEALPKFGWSIDPFGYSPTIPYLSKKRGMEGILIQRVHYAVKKELAKRKSLEFKWRQVWDETGEWDMMTHVMPFFSYDVPHTCGPDPSICCQFDFARLKNQFGGCPWRKKPVVISSSNVESRANLLIDQYRKKANLYRSNVVLIPLGDDFRYQNELEAENQFVNYQKIFDHVNANMKGVSIQFGTLSDYFNAIKGKFTPPILKGSFFTYSDIDEDYWSGYFTSRPYDKALSRRLESVLYAASTMGVTNEEVRDARRTLSLFQHHDGVTGTAKDHVVRDYAKRMLDSIQNVQGWMASKLGDAYAPCLVQDGPRMASYNACVDSDEVLVYNPLDTLQNYCGVEVPGKKTVKSKIASCDKHVRLSASSLQFDPKTGMVISPFKEKWMVWKVRKGGAYLFFPDQDAEVYARGVTVSDDGYSVTSAHWSRTIVEREDGVVDFIFETLLQENNQEWFVRFETDISNDGTSYTDLNGFNFDTHKYRPTLPIQAQVYPMPTLAAIQDGAHRFTVLSEHAQGTASLKDGTIDVWLDRRLGQDDARGLEQGVQDNVLTRTKLRVVAETDVGASGEFKPTQRCQRLWDELNHPPEAFHRTHRTIIGLIKMWLDLHTPL